MIFDIRKYSIHDGPGIRTTVFFKGCPLSCWWCHNPESQSAEREIMLRPSRCIRCGACVDACPEHAISLNDGGESSTDRQRCKVCGACVEVCYAEARQLAGRMASVEEVMADIERDTAFYDESGGGVTFSGGEPLMQPEFLRELLAACKGRGIHTALDTCGFAAWDTLDEVRSLVDLFLFDIKLVDEGLHQYATGVSNKLIFSNLERLSHLGHTIYLRVPVIPSVNDEPEELRKMAAFCASLPHIQRVDLLAYHNTALSKYESLGKTYTLPGSRSLLDERMEEIAGLFRGYGLKVKIGG